MSQKPCFWANDLHNSAQRLNYEMSSRAVFYKKLLWRTRRPPAPNEPENRAFHPSLHGVSPSKICSYHDTAEYPPVNAVFMKHLTFLGGFQALFRPCTENISSDSPPEGVSHWEILCRGGYQPPVQREIRSAGKGTGKIRWSREGLARPGSGPYRSCCSMGSPEGAGGRAAGCRPYREPGPP